MKPDNVYPILYSLRNCPYAMRARIALYKSKQVSELRDIVLSNKPPEMINASAKATVPVLVLPEGSIIDESLDIMIWALQNSDPDLLLHSKSKSLEDMLVTIRWFDNDFKSALDKYGCAKRYHETNLSECRASCEIFLEYLEQRLSAHTFLLANNESLVDIAIFPFIRKFARIERQWYLQSPYPNVRRWLNIYLQSRMFSKVMTKYPLWSTEQSATLFPS